MSRLETREQSKPTLFEAVKPPEITAVTILIPPDDCSLDSKITCLRSPELEPAEVGSEL